METIRTTYSAPSAFAMDLSVTMQDGSVRVGGGTVVMEGRSDTLEAETISIAVREFATVVICYLVRQQSTDTLLLFVDEHVQDGLDLPYIFSRDGDYHLLAYLFMLTVPAGTNDLRTLDYDRWRIVAEQ